MIGVSSLDTVPGRCTCQAVPVVYTDSRLSLTYWATRMFVLKDFHGYGWVYFQAVPSKVSNRVFGLGHVQVEKDPGGEKACSRGIFPICTAMAPRCLILTISTHHVIRGGSNTPVWMWMHSATLTQGRESFTRSPSSSILQKMQLLLFPHHLTGS